jgi:hypothetical protein
MRFLAGVEGVSHCRKLKRLEWQPNLSAHIDTKEFSCGLATRPPDRPPDPDNGSPGAVGTATGAEVQNSLEEPKESCRKPNVNVESAAALRADRSAFSHVNGQRDAPKSVAQQITRSNRHDRPVNFLSDAANQFTEAA